MALVVGVEERELALTGVEDLAGTATGLAVTNDASEEGVEALEGARCCLVGVADLEEVDFLASADGLPLPAREAFLLGKEAHLLVPVEG